MGSLTDVEWRAGVGVLVMTTSAVSCVIIRSFLLVLFSVVQVAGCFQDYPLSNFIISFGSVLDHPVYQNYSAARVDLSKKWLEFIVTQELLMDTTYSTTISAGNLVGIGMPSDEVKFCELF